ncbi:MAG: Kae1-associated serine/threonine protein kinase [Euryarchaeota archaeon]|nr:Kae1-associated serine/threonine protein kinase [Euryarchaeota archaeon]
MESPIQLDNVAIPEKVFRRGAEAVLTRERWHGREVVRKHRVPKGYRHPVLDEKLRKARLRMEARLMSGARRLGVSVPIIYDIDVGSNALVMEFIDGPQAKEALGPMTPGERKALCTEIGRIAGRLHGGGIVHGDLTTSNMILKGEKVYLIDFSLGEVSSEPEAIGVDLHLLREAFHSAHSSFAPDFDYVLEGYRETFPGAKAAERTMREIEDRGRYR